MPSPPSSRTPPAAGDRPPLAEALGRRVNALAAHLHDALGGDGRGVHQARVATRRLREIQPVVMDVAKGRGAKLRRRLKRLTRALGPVRELDVAFALLTDRAAGRADPGVVALRAHLTARRLDALDALRDACDAGRASRLIARLGDDVRALERIGRGAGDLPARERRRLARRVADRARDLGVAVAESGALLIVERIHAVRTAAKRLRYAIELTGELRLVRTAALVAGLKAMQDILGELHELDVLRAEAVRVHASLPPGSIVARDLERIAAGIEADIRQLHARYLRRARALAVLTDRVQDRIAPCLDPSIST